MQIGFYNGNLLAINFIFHISTSIRNKPDQKLHQPSWSLHSSPYFQLHLKQTHWETLGDCHLCSSVEKRRGAEKKAAKNECKKRQVEWCPWRQRHDFHTSCAHTNSRSFPSVSVEMQLISDVWADKKGTLTTYASSSEIFVCLESGWYMARLQS